MNRYKPLSADDIYVHILWYIEDGNWARLAYKRLSANMEGIKSKISWNLTEDNLSLLYRCVNNSIGLDHELWTETREEFLISAFRDLSTFRNPRAMGIFGRLCNICADHDTDLFLWAKTVTKRPDGSAVIIMHVSNLEAFEEIVDDARRRHGTGDDLRKGLIIYR